MREYFLIFVVAGAITYSRPYCARWPSRPTPSRRCASATSTRRRHRGPAGWPSSWGSPRPAWSRSCRTSRACTAEADLRCAHGRGDRLPRRGHRRHPRAGLADQAGRPDPRGRRDGLQGRRAARDPLRDEHRPSVGGTRRGHRHRRPCDGQCGQLHRRAGRAGGRRRGDRRLRLLHLLSTSRPATTCRTSSPTRRSSARRCSAASGSAHNFTPLACSWATRARSCSVSCCPRRRSRSAATSTWFGQRRVGHRGVAVGRPARGAEPAVPRHGPRRGAPHPRGQETLGRRPQAPPPPDARARPRPRNAVLILYMWARCSRWAPSPSPSSRAGGRRS